VRTVTATGDLPSLLATGEHAAFHGKPAAAVGALEQAIVLAQSEGQAAEMAAAAWLLGVALAAGGRYGGALTVLSPLVDAGRAGGAAPEHRLFAALASSTIASVHRQLGRHAVAQEADLTAEGLADGAPEAVFDAELGLASDAIGLEDVDEATRRLERAAALLPARSGEWWRQRVRQGWVEAEVALLEGRADDAAATAVVAVQRAEQARAPRHVAKGLLILGIAQVSADSAEFDDATVTLRRAATLAESLGTVPLIWPARALLGALVADSDPGESARSLAAARSAVLAVAGDLPPNVRAEWLARPDVAALLEG
jgi:tetratricopeptide (TPR) repeat protein